MVEREIEVVNKRGLHARAAAKFVQLASGFESRVTVRRGEEEADGKSILSLMVLGAGPGTRLGLAADGPDESEALEALTSLVGKGFAEAD